MQYKEVAIPYESVDPAVLASNAAEEFICRDREIVRIPEKIWLQKFGRRKKAL